MQKLLAEKEEAEEILNGLDEEKAKLEEQLNTIQQKCAEEADLVGLGNICKNVQVFCICNGRMGVRWVDRCSCGEERQ